MRILLCFTVCMFLSSVHASLICNNVHLCYNFGLLTKIVLVFIVVVTVLAV